MISEIPIRNLEGKLEAMNELKYKLHKKCWSGCDINLARLKDYVGFVLDYAASDFITSDDLRYAQIYLHILENQKKNDERRRK